MNNLCTFYAIVRFLVGPVDFVTDVFHAIHLIRENHPVWGSLTILLPFLGLLAALVSTIIGKIKRGTDLPAKKFALLTITSLTLLYEALFESLPQLVLQCTAIWRGVVNVAGIIKVPRLRKQLAIVSFVCLFSGAGLLGCHYCHIYDF